MLVGEPVAEDFGGEPLPHLRCVVMRAQTDTTDKRTLMIASGTNTTT